MNKFAARGLLQDAVEGRHILVLTIGVHEIVHVLGEFKDQCGASLPARVALSRGHGSIRIEGAGRIHVKSWRQTLRGTRFDTVYLDTGVDSELRSLDRLKELRAVIATSDRGEIIRA